MRFQSEKMTVWWLTTTARPEILRRPHKVFQNAEKEHTMRLSTKSRFAVTAMIDVALREDRGPVSLAAISVRHQISLS